jgi:hypothetical protein
LAGVSPKYSGLSMPERKADGGLWKPGSALIPWHSVLVTVSSKDESKENLVPLSQYRARLARGQRARRAQELFDSPDPEAAIRALPPDEFYYVIHELGFPEAMEVLVHGTADQVQTVLDFSVWDRDRVTMEKADEWLAALVEAPPETLGQWAQGIDVELLALLLRKRTHIYDLSLEEAPDNPEGVLWDSPDRLFTLEFIGEEDQVRVTQHLADSLYRYSPVMMRRLLVGMRAEDDAELEETAYRWRSGRMADLGFVDFYEALVAYQELDPASVRIGDNPPPSLLPRGETLDTIHLRLPLVVAERLSGKTPFARAVGGLETREEAAELHFALVALCNRVLAANKLDPSDEEAIRAALERLSATLDIAVEFLSRGDRDRETAAVRTVPLLQLHRLGVSLIGKLRRLASALVRGNPFATLRPAVDVFEPEDAEILASLTRTRPAFPRLLDAPPAPGERPFACLADIATATHAVERAAAAVEMLTGLGVRPQQLTAEALESMARTASADGTKAIIDPAAIDAGVLARTVLVARLLGSQPAAPTVLSIAAINKFKHNFNSGPQLPESAALQTMDIMRESSRSSPLDGANREVALRWMGSLCPLGPVLGDPRP